jgi:hypothetical protein
MHVQALVAQRSVECLHEAVVGRLARPAEVELNLMVIGPQLQQPPREFGSVVDEQISRRLALRDHYRQGGLPNFATAPALQPGGRLDVALTGVGYPAPVVPANMLANDRFSKIKSWADEMKLGRSDSRNGWIRT